MLSIGTATLTVLVLIGVGCILDRWLFADAPRRADEAWISILSLGILGLGLGTLLLGYAHLLYRPVFLIAGLAAMASLVVLRGRVVALGSETARGLWNAVRRYPVLCVATVATYALSMDLAMRAPLGSDEGDYKWGTPLAFAVHHHIVHVNARLSNGIYLSELVVVPAAVFRSLHGARVVQIVGVALLALAVRVVARRLGGAGNLAAFATLGCMVVATFSVSVGSDILAAALLTAAMAFVLTTDAGPREFLAGGFALMGAVTTKQYTALLVPLFLVVAIAVDAQPDGVGWRTFAEIRSRCARVVAVIAVPSLAILLVGFAHTWVVVGKPIDRYGLGVFASNDPRVSDGRAAGRIPSLRDLAVLPAVPAFVGVRGGEPYGRRVGLYLPIALGVAALGAFLADRRWRRRILLASALAAASFLGVAPVFIKTRFLIFSWVLVFVAADIAVASRAALDSRRVARLVTFAVSVAILAGFADSIRWLLDRYWLHQFH